ncbi:type V CRISPR-associated protein Cas12k [Leptothoe spongobia]|uniref:Type V CRISPR-associated protein Cas12k n=1 Tax=Leptothoe spongobia TAU-MAC 1115 TaxID=1967444 RepID=A0A947DE74_9CYAN|nr:type V CRISPR-associated protein Cas12k [Leptothoe spongobia]MBT9315120.1 type V CRISPR-associated protein Cas12k [Leptothoe spongobia TAU-MAC 1115]
MSADYFTIRCALTASQETRRHLWTLMQPYTLLVNDLLELIPQQPEFSQWRQQGYIPNSKAIKPLHDALKHQPAYAHLPGRFHDSAKRLTSEIYASWLASHRKRLAQIIGKQRWIQAVETELELAKVHLVSLDDIRQNAQNALSKARKKLSQQKPKDDSIHLERELLGILLEMHEATKSPLRKRAINHLLVNKLEVPAQEINLRTLQELLEAKKIEVQRLEVQIQSQLPKGRDPTGQRHLQMLLDTVMLPEETNPDEVDEATVEEQLTQQQQMPLWNELPYPVSYSGSGEFYWKQNSDKISVSFKGLSNYEFVVNCDRRQLPIFKQFVADYQTNRSRSQEEQFSGALFTLRSVQLLWLPDKRLKHRNKLNRKKGKPEYTDPWDTHRLYLHCSIDRRALTAEGTEQIQHEEQTAVQQIVSKAIELQNTSNLSPDQSRNLKRKQTQLQRLQNNSPPPRPSQSTYQGNPQLVMGISFSRHEPVTVAVADVSLDQVLETYNTRALLRQGPQKKLWRNGKLKIVSKDDAERYHPNKGQLNTRQPGSETKAKPYRLVNRVQQQYQQDRRLRAKAQQQDRCFHKSSVSKSASNLSLYLNRLIAAKLVELACDRQVATIVVPKLEGIRESVESDIQASATRKYPNDKNRQKQYRKEYRASFHAWPYQELAACIQACARKHGLKVVIAKQLSSVSLVEKSAKMALSQRQVEAA